ITIWQYPSGIGSKPIILDDLVFAVSELDTIAAKIQKRTIRNPGTDGVVNADSCSRIIYGWADERNTGDAQKTIRHWSGRGAVGTHACARDSHAVIPATT